MECGREILILCNTDCCGLCIMADKITLRLDGGEKKHNLVMTVNMFHYVKVNKMIDTSFVLI